MSHRPLRRATRASHLAPVRPLVRRLIAAFEAPEAFKPQAPSKFQALSRSGRISFESLEPRVLLSADLAPGIPQTVIDSDGTAIHVDLTGPGEGEVEQVQGDDGNLRLRLLLRGTTADSEVDISAAGGDGAFVIDAIDVSGSLGRLAASAGTLAGSVQATGAIADLTLAEVIGGDVTADALGTLTVAGDFSGGLLLRGAVAGLTLGNATISGELDGTWNVLGRTGALRAGSVSDEWLGAFGAAVTSIATQGDFGGTLAASALQQLTVGGDLSAADLYIGTTLGTNGAFGGTGSDADTFGPGNLNRVRVSGAVSDTVIRVGVDPVSGAFDDGDDAFPGASRIQEFLAGGPVTGSRIVAATLPPQVRVGGVLVPTANVAAFLTESPDGVAPVIVAALQTDTGESPDDGITNDASIAGTLTDRGGFARLFASFGGTVVDVSQAVAADGSFILDRARLGAVAGGQLADGAHVLRLTALDAAGNAATAVEVAFELDTSVAPGAAFGLTLADAKGGDDGVAAAASVVLRGTVEAGAMVFTGPLRTRAGGDGTFVLPGVALALGENSIALTVTDIAGNTQTLTRTLTRVAETTADAVLAWNAIALRAIQLDVTDPPVATRTLAMLGLAQYDALAAIEGSPAFLVRLSAAGADITAALATAAHRILTQVYPAQKAVFDAALTAQLGDVPDGAAEDAGIALGIAVADAILAARADDGAGAFVEYTGSETPGLWRPTGPMFDVPDHPEWQDVTPFVLDAPGQFRPGPPPALDSAAYAASVNEIKALGSAASTTRTEDQTQIAHFWADGKGSFTPPGHWNAIAAQVAAAEGQGLSANARLFAQLNVALADAAIACWDAKYAYGLWRPETAIREADTDGNAATEADAAWQSLLITPAHPEYPSGHSTFSAAAAAILAATFGDDTAFSTTSETLPGVTRDFDSFAEAAQEAGRSRVYGGIHYEFTNQIGQALGRQVAEAVLERFATVEDAQGPTVAITGVAPVAAANPTFGGQVLDNLSGVADAQWRIDNGTAQPLALDGLGRFSVTSALALDGSADGAHVFSVTATDFAGNVRTVETAWVLDTRAPVVTLNGLAEGSAVSAASRMAGSADGTGSAIVSLRYSLGGQTERPLAFDIATGAFDEPLVLGDLAAGEHVLRVVATDAAGNDTVVERSVTLAARPLATITRATPDTGIDDVGVTFRPQITFSRAVDVSTLTAESFYATGPGGQKLAATIVPSKDATFAWLFFDAPMPGGAVITVHVNGDLIRAASDGSLLDADGDGQAGGGFTHRFTTASTASIPPTTVTGTDGTPVVIRTSLVGKVVDPGADLEPMTFDDMRRGPDGVIHTADDVFLNPIAHAKVWILGLEDRFVYTDAQGNFELLDVPAGTVKLAIDGRTATNAPAGTFWPEMVMDLVLEAGAVNTAMGTMGSREERAANADRREVYLPRLPQSILQDVSATQDTVIGVDAAAAPNLSEAQRAQLQLVVEAGSLVDEHGNVIDAGQVGISTVPPELVRDMLPPGVLQHTFDITIQAPGVAAFNTPLQLTMPNTFGAAPGEKVNFLSFDHTTGRLVIEGTATVSADGLTITTDPGQGITKPGWHGWTPRGSRLSAGLLPALLPGDFEGGMNLPPEDTDFSDGDGSDPRVLATFKAPERDPLLPEDQQPYLVITIEPDGNAGAYLKETAGSLLPITGGSIRLNAGDPRTYEFGVENLPLADVTAPSGGKGIASFATNVLFTNAFKIAKTLVEPGKGENGSTRSTTEEKTSHVGRYIDATDDRVDTTIRFSDTLADGSVSRTKNIQFVSGFASAPVSATLSGSSDFQESFSGGGVTLTFDPSAVHSAGASLQIVTPGSPGGAPNRTSIAMNGVGTAPYQVAVDRSSLDTMLLSIFIEKTPVLNPLDDSVVPELETVAGRQQVINDVIARVGQYYAGFDGISVVGAQSPAISARTIAAYAKATNARPFNPSAAQTLGAAPLDLEIAPLVANVLQTNNGLSSAQRMFLMDSYINNEGAGHPGYLHHDAFAVYEALVNESPGNLLDTPSHDELVNALAENIAHEAGHTLGLVHANGIFPSDVMAQGTDPDGTKTFTNSTAATLRMALNLEYTTADANAALSLLVTRYNVTGGQLQDNLPDDIPLPVPTPVAEVPVPLLQDTQDGAAVFGEIDLGALIADGPGGSATTRSFDLLNFGSGDLVVKSVRIVDGDGAVRLSGFAGGDVIAFGERQTFTLSFDPLAPVDLDARLIVETDGPAGTVEYRLTGSAQASSGHAALEARNNAAGGLAVGSVLEQAQAYVLENRGATPLTITGLRVVEGGGQFSLTGLPANLATTPLQLAAGASLDIGLRYIASKAGLERGVFELTTNDPLHPLLRLTVSGTGIAAGELVDWGSDYVMLQTGADGAGVVRLVSEDDGGFEFFGPADGRYTVLIFDPATGLVARGQGTTPASGGQKDITGSLVFRGSQGTDTDGDGLTDEIESILGLAPGNTDSDRDGIDDFRELALGLDPLDGRVARTGVIGSLALPGEAKAVALAGPLDGGTGQTVFVATGTHGLAIVTVSPDNVATLVGQIDLPGDAVDVSIDAALGVAAIASGSGGLHRVDISDISAPRLLETHAINASQVEVHEGVIYAAVGTELRAYDLLTGEKVAAVVTSSRIAALEREGDTLFTLDATRALTAYDIGDGTFDRRGSLSIPGSPASLFVGGGVAYIGAAPDARSQGFATVDVSNPSAMVLISGADDPTVITGTLAANGSGLLISGGRIAGPSGLIQAVDVMNVRDLSDTQTRIARFTLGDAPVDIAIGGGLAFIAAGRSDLQIVSYLGSDMQGLAPVLSADGAALDVDPLADGIQVQEGSTVQLPVTVADDQQVASVELLLNGQVVRTDTGFPFELSTALPTLAANGGRTTVTLQVRATDTGGNVGLAPPVTVTLVPDTVGPALVESSIEEGDEKSRSLRSITLLFSEALDAATVNGTTVRLIGPDGNAVPDPQVQFRQQGREVQLTWAPLPAVGSYRFVLEAGAITDRAGNPLGTATVETAFTVQNYSTEWIGPAGGFWDVGANWSEGTVPTADDDVFVGGLPEGAGITFRTGTVTVATLTGEARLLVTGGALTVAGELRLDDGLRITGGAFNAPTGGNVDGLLELAGGTLTLDGSLDVQSLALSGGTLTGSGSISVAADSTWTGGAVTGTGTLSFLGDLSISGAASKVLTGGRVVNTLGTTTWAGATTANTNDFFTGPATIHNAGTWIDANVATTIVRDWYAGDPATFDNTGTYRKTGAGTSTLQMKFDNRGTIRVEAGVLSLDSGGVSGAEGTIDIAAGATLRFGGGEFHLEDAVVTGPGTLQVAGTFNTTTSVIHTGTTTLAGQLSLVGGTLFANGVLNAASYAQAANYAFLDGTGVVDVAGAATWSDGNMQGTGTIRFRGDLAISGAGDKAVSGGRIIETFGTTTWRGATVANTNDFYTGPGTINNAGTWIDDNAFDTIVRDWYSGEPLVFNNSGTYRKLGGSTSTLQIAFRNTGRIEVEGGILSLQSGGGTTSAGAIDIDAGATLRLSGGEHRLEGTPVSGTGRLEVAGTFNTTTNVIHTGTTVFAGQLSLIGGTLTANGTLEVGTYAQTANYAFLEGSGVVDVAGAATWSDGNMDGTGTIHFRGDLAISGAGDKALTGGRSVHTYGTTTWRGATGANNNDFYTGPATFTNHGTFVDDNAFNTIVRDWFAGDPARFVNLGTYRKTSATVSRLEWVLDNQGTMDLDAGTLLLVRGGANSGGIDLAADAVLQLASGDVAWNEGTAVSGAGRLLLNGAELTVNTDIELAHIDLAGGTLTGNATVTLTGTGNTWTSGFMTGGGTTRILADADLTLSGGNRKYLGARILDLQGTLVESSTGDLLDLEGAATLNLSGLLDIRGDTAWQDYSSASGSLALTIADTGIIRKSAGAGQFEFLHTTLDQSGRVEVQSGTLGLGGASSSDGEYVTAADTEIAFLYGTHVWNEGVTVTGDGIIALRNLTGSLAATLDVAAARIDVPRLDLRVLATLTGTGTVALTGTESEWTGGFMTGGGTTRIEPGAVLTVSGPARKYLGNRTIDVQGTLVESSSGDLLDLEGAATLNIAGTMDIRVDTAWQDYSSGPGTLVVNNTGSLLKSAGTGQFEFLHTALNNTGLVHAKAGQLAFGGDGGVSIGEFRADSGTDIAFLYGTQTWNDGAQATGAGTLSLRNLSGSLGGTLSVNGTTVTAERLNLGPLGALTGTGLFTITGTGSRWTAGFMTGGGTTRIDTGADLTLAGGSRKFLGTRTLDVRGTLVEESTGDLLDLEGAATLNVSGTFDIRGDTAWQHFTSAPGTLTIGNTGVIRKSAGAGTFEFLNSSLTNTGTVEVTAGTLRFSAPVVQNGQVTVGAGATLILGAQTILGPFPTPPAPPAPLAAPDTTMQIAASPDPAAMVAAGQATAVPESAARPLVLQVARPSTSLGTSATRAAAEDETPASVGVRLHSLLSGNSAVDWRKDFRQALRLLRWLR